MTIPVADHRKTAFEYCMTVRNRFKHDMNKYSEFIEVMRSFKSREIGPRDMIAVLQVLFKGHEDLMWRFKICFLDKIRKRDAEIELMESVEYEEAVKFMQKAKAELNDKVYLSFLDVVLNRHGKDKNSNVKKTYEEAAAILESQQPELLNEFRRFLPPQNFGGNNKQAPPKIDPKEDAMFKYDLELNRLETTYESVKTLLKRIDRDGYKTKLKIEEHLKPLNLRCIETSYDAYGLNVIEELSENAARVLPVILNRLNKKHQEWSDFYKEQYPESIKRRRLGGPDEVKEVKGSMKRRCNEDDVAS